MEDDIDVPNSIKIIGSESQTIHIILKKNEKININKNYILYASSEDLEELTYKNVSSLIRTSESSNKEQLKKVENENIVRLKNKESNIEYIGLSRGGKILKITPFLYSNLFIKIGSILAFNEGVEILKDKDIDNKMNKIIPRNYNMQFGFKDFVEMFMINKCEFCLVRTKISMSSYLLKDQESQDIININSYLNDFVYISGRKNLIEKRLGEGETMVIMPNSLVAFEQSITFNTIKKTAKKDQYVNSLNDIVVEGPGLIIFELIDRKMPIYNSMGNKMFIIFTIVLFVVEILAQFFVHFNLRQ